MAIFNDIAPLRDRQNYCEFDHILKSPNNVSSLSIVLNRCKMEKL